ncbi:MAG: hypothetical protein PWQ55_1082 [Chloroflexota bacterium]|nr:hypothetical protein [Chloroflexota bacterium]
MLKTRKVILRLAFLLLCVGGLLAYASPIEAQSSLNLSMNAPDLSQFPKITLYLNASDSQNKFVYGLDLNNFSVFEDGVQRTVNEVQQLEPGLHTIIALNLGATLSNRANTSVPTRYEETIYSIASWLNKLQSSAPNQYSLTSNEGTLVESSQEKTTFVNTLQNYKPNLFNFEPNLASLTSALDVAAKPSLVDQSKQEILYITPLPLDQDLPKLAELQARAQQIGVPVNVWLVAPETAANAPAQQYLNQLASATGGKFLFYSEGLTTPDPEEYVGRMRSIYRLRYTSTVSQSGTHTVKAIASYGNLTAETPETQFTIELNTPSAVLVNLPPIIERTYADSTEGKILQPGVITLQAVITFPDGYQRQLRATRLYVDGQVIQENTEEPFDYFGWQLDSYRFSSQHLVAVEVEDILGFRNISPPASVQINVASPYPTWLMGILRFISVGGWIPLALVAAGGTLFAGLRLRRRWLERRIRSEGMVFDEVDDPMLQSVPGLGSALDTDYYAENNSRANATAANPRDIAPRLVWAGSAAPPAQLAELREIVLEKPETILGSDSTQAGVLLPDAGISPQHTVLRKNERGSVQIADLGSESGTWVNYAPVSSAGLLLHNGDLVRIGSFTFRYKIGKIY